jgi:transposase
MFSYVSAEQRIPKDHPLRAIRRLVDGVLADMSREFDRLYATTGRASIPPERLLRAQLLRSFYSIRSELLLMEQLEYNLLFRWFIGLTMDDPVWGCRDLHDEGDVSSHGRFDAPDATRTERRRRSVTNRSVRSGPRERILVVLSGSS